MDSREVMGSKMLASLAKSGDTGGFSGAFRFSFAISKGPLPWQSTRGTRDLHRRALATKCFCKSKNALGLWGLQWCVSSSLATRSAVDCAEPGKSSANAMATSPDGRSCQKRHGPSLSPSKAKCLIIARIISVLRRLSSALSSKFLALAAVQPLFFSN